MSSFSRIEKLLNEKGISAAQMMKDLGYSSGLFSQWRSKDKNGIDPPQKSLRKVAEYLDTTYEYLAYGFSQDATDLRIDEFYSIYQSLSGSQRQEAIDFLKFLKSKESHPE